MRYDSTNSFCYIITGCVFIYFYISFIFDFVYSSDANYLGIKRTTAFERTDNRYYLLPTISFSYWTVKQRSNEKSGGIEIFINWLNFRLYIVYTKDINSDD